SIYTHCGVIQSHFFIRCVCKILFFHITFSFSGIVFYVYFSNTLSCFFHRYTFLTCITTIKCLYLFFYLLSSLYIVLLYLIHKLTVVFNEPFAIFFFTFTPITTTLHR